MFYLFLKTENSRRVVDRVRSVCSMGMIVRLKKNRSPEYLSSNDNFIKTVAIDTPGGNLNLKIKSRAQQITLRPNITKVKKIIS